MKPGTATILSCALVLATALPAVAQHDVMRRNYTFLQRNLAIDVEADAPGVLHIVRGTPGQLEVAARASGGLPGFGLAGRPRDHLRLSAVGAQRAEYIVVVPEHVRVQVRLPGQVAEAVPGGRSARYEWATAALADLPPPLAAVGTTTRVEHALATYESRSAPAGLDVTDLRGIRTLEVHTGEDAFGIVSSTATEVLDLGGGRLGLRVRDGGPADIVIRVPRGTTAFTLTVAGEDALVPVGTGRFEARCMPVTTQQLAEAQRFTFTPEGRPLACRWT